MMLFLQFAWYAVVYRGPSSGARAKAHLSWGHGIAAALVVSTA